MDTVIDDVVEGTVTGYDGFDPNGKSVRIFLDMVAFLGDYPATAAVSDVRGHTKN